MEELSYLIAGWLFGLISPNLVDRLRRPYVRRQLADSVLAELDEMRYTMASAAYAAKDHLVETSDEFLDWVIPIITAYEGPRASARLGPTVKHLRSLGQEQRLAALGAAKVSGRSLGLKEYGLPFTAAKASDLSVCSLGFQRGVFAVIGQLDQFNQQVRHQVRQEELTFDPQVLESSADAVNDNLVRGSRRLGEIAIVVANSITQLELAHRAG